MTLETWKRHPVHVNYEVSDMGRVRRCTECSCSYIGKILKPGYVVTRRFLAEKFGVGKSIIDDVISRETWRHV